MSSSEELFQALTEHDARLSEQKEVLIARIEHALKAEKEIERNEGSLLDFARSYQRYGLHQVEGGFEFREWAPGARRLSVVGDFNSWDANANVAQQDEFGTWTCFIVAEIAHDSCYAVSMTLADGSERVRVPTWARFVRENEDNKTWCARYWSPPTPYQWRYETPLPQFTGQNARSLHIYEAHVGIASEEHRVATWCNFTRSVLPHAVAAGYNCLQLMSVAEHALYASYGYLLTSLFAPSSRFGTPEELKELIDTAHGFGMVVLLDIVHSHADDNADVGFSRFDGTDTHYFHDYRTDKGKHPIWGSRLYNYGNYETKRFLLSNIAYWMDEFRFDGFRFDAVTSMLYWHHGENGNECTPFVADVIDSDAAAYLTMATRVAQLARDGAITAAEDFSQWPGLTVPRERGGIGFGFLLAVHHSDIWTEYGRRADDLEWNMDDIVARLCAQPADVRTVTYSECHDHSIEDRKTNVQLFFSGDNERGIALHKMIRLLSCALGSNAWLCFMGNEFGHPDGLDFPRERNNNSFEFARRRWSLLDDSTLHHIKLLAFDRAMLALETRTAWLRAERAFISRVNQSDKTIVFDRPRGELFFVFNFHPTNVYENYPIGVDRAGTYELLLDSNAKRFGGSNENSNQVAVLDSQPGLPDAEPKAHTININIAPRSVQVYRFATKY